MIVALGLLGFSFASAGAILFELRNAPEGYEDHSGFHLVRKAANRREIGAFLRMETSLAGKQAARNRRVSLTSPA